MAVTKHTIAEKPLLGPAFSASPPVAAASVPPAGSPKPLLGPAFSPVASPVPPAVPAATPATPVKPLLGPAFASAPTTSSVLASAPVPVKIVAATVPVPVVAPARGVATEFGPRADAKWEAERPKAKQVVAREMEQEGDLKAIADSRRQRESAQADVAMKNRQTQVIGAKAQAVIGEGGQVAAGLARNAPAAAAAAGIETAVAGLSKLGPYGMAAGAALATVAKVGTAASEAVDAFVKRGRELSGFSGQLAGASAQADIRSMQADMREAKELGPQMAAMIENQSKLETVFREIMLPIKDWLLGILNGMVESTLSAIPDILELLNGILQGVTLGLGRSDAIDKTIKRIRDIIAKKDEEIPIMDMFLRAADGFKAPVMPPMPMPGAGALGIPILGGI